MTNDKPDASPEVVITHCGSCGRPFGRHHRWTHHDDALKQGRVTLYDVVHFGCRHSRRHRLADQAVLEAALGDFASGGDLGDIAKALDMDIRTAAGSFGRLVAAGKLHGRLEWDSQHRRILWTPAELRRSTQDQET